MNVALVLVLLMSSGVWADFTLNLGGRRVVSTALSHSQTPGRETSSHSDSEDSHDSDSQPPAPQSGNVNPYAKSGFKSRNRDAPDEKIVNYFDLNWESEEITNAVDFIEFKMQEVFSLIQECVMDAIQRNPFGAPREIKVECVGPSYDILYMTYKEGLRKVREILFEIVKIKLQEMDEMYNNEVNFFLDVLDQLVDADFEIMGSIQIVRQKAAKYYVASEFMTNVIEACKPELKAFSDLHIRLKNYRNRAQMEVEKLLQRLVVLPPEVEEPEESESEDESEEETRGKEEDAGEEESEESSEEEEKEEEPSEEEEQSGSEDQEKEEEEEEKEESGEENEEAPGNEEEEPTPSEPEPQPQPPVEEPAPDSFSPIDEEADFGEPQPGNPAVAADQKAPEQEGWKTRLVPKEQGVIGQLSKMPTKIVDGGIDAIGQVVNSSFGKAFTGGISTGIKTATAPMMLALKMAGMGRARKAKEEEPTYITSANPSKRRHHRHHKHHAKSLKSRDAAKPSHPKITQ